MAISIDVKLHAQEILSHMIAGCSSIQGIPKSSMIPTMVERAIEIAAAFDQAAKKLS